MEDKTQSEPATKADLNELEQRLNAKISSSDKKVDSLDEKVDSVKTELKADINRLDAKVGQLDAKVGQLDAKVGQLDQTVNTLGIGVAKLHLRVDQSETNIMTGLRDFKSELLAAFEQSVVKGQMYDQKTVTHGAILTDHGDKLLKHETRITLLETKK